jgi:hypothetical protein
MLAVGRLPQQGQTLIVVDAAEGAVQPLRALAARCTVQHQVRPVDLQRGGDDRRGGQVQAGMTPVSRQSAWRSSSSSLARSMHRARPHALGQVAAAQVGDHRAQPAPPGRVARPVDGRQRRPAGTCGAVECVGIGQRHRGESAAAPPAGCAPARP